MKPDDLLNVQIDLNRALLRLSDTYRQFLILYFKVGWTCLEIGKEYNCNRWIVDRMLGHACLDMRRELKGYKEANRNVRKNNPQATKA